MEKLYDTMATVFESDDGLAALTSENKKLRELVRVLEERNRGMQNEANAAKRAAQSWQRRAEKGEKVMASNLSESRFNHPNAIRLHDEGFQVEGQSKLLEA